MEKGFTLTEGDYAFASNIAKSYGSKYSLRTLGIEMDELIAIANLALVKASIRYRKDKGTLFTSYAFFWIRNDINQFIRKTGKELSHTISYDQFDKLPERIESQVDKEPETISAELDKVTKRVSAFLIKSSIKRKRKESKEVLEKVCDMMIRGVPAKKIAKDCDIPLDRVYALTIDFRKAARANRERIEEIVL